MLRMRGKNWRDCLSFLGYACLLMLVLGLGSGCKNRANRPLMGSDELRDFFRQLPDSLRENPFGERQGMELSQAQLDELVAKGSLETAQGYTWRLDFADSAQTHLKISRSGPEEALRYELLTLPGPRPTKWVLVLQGLEDHCCSHGRWALYLGKKGEWYDQTAIRMPQLGWENFFTPAQLGASPPPRPRENRYPFSMKLASEPRGIEIQLVADYLELNYPENQVKSMLANFPTAPLQFVWWREHFIEQNEQNSQN